MIYLITMEQLKHFKDQNRKKNTLKTKAGFILYFTDQYENFGLNKFFLF